MIQECVVKEIDGVIAQATMTNQETHTNNYASNHSNKQETIENNEGVGLKGSNVYSLNMPLRQHVWHRLGVGSVR